MKNLLTTLLILFALTCKAQTITAPTFINAADANGDCVLGVGNYTVTGNIFWVSLNINGIDWDGSGLTLFNYNGVTIKKCWLVQHGLPDLVPGSTYNIFLRGWTGTTPPYILVATSPTVTYTVPSTYNCTQTCKKKKRHP